MYEVEQAVEKLNFVGEQRQSPGIGSPQKLGYALFE